MLKQIVLGIVLLIGTSAFAGDREVFGSGIATDEAAAVQNAMNSIDCDGMLQNVRVTVHSNGGVYNAEVSAICHTSDSGVRLISTAAGAQEVQHDFTKQTPTVSGCRAYATVLGHAEPDSWKPLSLAQIDNMLDELTACSTIDSRRALEYLDVYFQVDEVESTRMRRYLNRHNLTQQLKDEDAAGVGR